MVSCAKTSLSLSLPPPPPLLLLLFLGRDTGSVNLDLGADFDYADGHISLLGSPPQIALTMRVTPRR